MEGRQRMAGEDDADAGLLLDVVGTLTTNARRVAGTAIDDAEAAGDPDLIGRVAAALTTETEAIVLGCDPANVRLIRAVEAAGRAITTVAVQALRTGIHPPRESLERAFDLFESFIAGPGRARIVDREDSAPADR